MEKFVEKSIKNGIDIIRIFDALNDIRNLECAVRATKKYGGECQIALSYTTSPVHTVEYYVNLAKEIEKLGADSICIKDMAGVLLPTAAYELISALKKNTKLPIELHSHCTGGLCEMTYLKAIEAGVDIVDCAISPLSGGTSQPCTESLNFALQGTEYDPKLNITILTDGRWVAKIMCIPTARAFCVIRAIGVSTCLPACMIKSPYSSMMMTIYGRNWWCKPSPTCLFGLRRRRMNLSL